MPKIENALVYDSSKRKFLKKTFCYSNGIIEENNNDEVVDMPQAYIIPGLIDVHTHGRQGIDIMAASEEELSRLSFEYAKTGVTSVFPTVMTAPIESVVSASVRIKKARPLGADICGVHVEGPYISKSKLGCHNAEYVRKPDLSEMLKLVNSVFPLKTHFTVAPEECDGSLIKELSEKATVGIGHTAATEINARKALSLGAISFTHTFNAMTSLLHRAPGCVGAALDSNAFAEFICDGFHLDPTVISISYKAKGADKFVLITDSIPQAGMKDGDYEMNGIPFSLSGQSAKKSDGTIVGSALDMLTAVKNLAKFANIPFETALICATKTPAEMMSLSDRGTLDVGKRADFVILDKDKNISSVFVGGKKIV